MAEMDETMRGKLGRLERERGDCERRAKAEEVGAQRREAERGRLEEERRTFATRFSVQQLESQAAQTAGRDSRSHSVSGKAPLACGTLRIPCGRRPAGEFRWRRTRRRKRPSTRNRRQVPSHTSK